MSFLWGEVNVTMPRRVLCMADRTGKQRHIRLPLGGDSVYVGQRAALRVRFRSVIHVNRAIMRRIIASLTKASLTAGRCS